MATRSCRLRVCFRIVHEKGEDSAYADVLNISPRGTFSSTSPSGSDSLLAPTDQAPVTDKRCACSSDFPTTGVRCDACWLEETINLVGIEFLGVVPEKWTPGDHIVTGRVRLDTQESVDGTDYDEHFERD
jgi:hypothetical protein